MIDERLLELGPDWGVPPFVFVCVAGVDGHPERASDHADSSAGPRGADGVGLSRPIGLVPGVVRVLAQSRAGSGASLTPIRGGWRRFGTHNAHDWVSSSFG